MQRTFNMGQNAAFLQHDVQKEMARGISAAGENGGTSGLMGMGMAMGGLNGFGTFQQPVQNPYAYGQQPYGQSPQQQAYGQPPQQAQPTPTPVITPMQASSDTWKCSCGTENTSKFCMNCGKKLG